MARINQPGTFEFAGQTLEATETTLPDLWSQTKQGTLPQIIAIGTSDLHLTDKAPIARAEKDWFQVQRRALVELRNLRNRLGGVPILVAGDIFNKWNAKPEVVNFALENLPSGILAVPGNHDLPYHDYKLIEKSAYGTLMRADKIVNVHPLKPVHKYDMDSQTPFVVHGFPHGFPIGEMVEDERTRSLNIALVHDYIWAGNDNKYINAPEVQHHSKYHTKLRRHGYNVAIFGDNHKGFFNSGYRAKGAWPVPIFNCGTFICRTTDERKYRPRVALIFTDGSVMPYYMDTSKDEWEEPREMERKAKEKVDGKGVADALMKLGEAGIEFDAALRHYANSHKKKIPSDVRSLILEVLEEIEE